MAPALPFRPIVVETAAAGRLRIIHTVRDAAEQLSATGRPSIAAPSGATPARPAIRPSPGRPRTPQSARAAFILAAKEAGIFVSEGDDEWR